MNSITINRNGNDEIFNKILKSLIGPMDFNGKRLMDLCCNLAPHTSKLPFTDKWFLDVEQREIPDQSRFILADALGDHPKLQEHYDVVTCLDGIEHIIKSDGFRLVDRMKKMADRVIIFTPLDPWMVEAETSHAYWHDPKSHKCVWSPNDLPDWAHIVLPVYHPTLNIGAFFSWYCQDLDNDFLRVKEDLREEQES